MRFVDDVRRYITPLYVRLLKEQRVRLGVDRLMPYDATLVFPDGNAKPVCGDDALENAARIMYHGLSSEAGLELPFADGAVERAAQMLARQ